ETSYGMLRSMADDREGTSAYDRDKAIQALARHPQAEQSLDKFQEWMQDPGDDNAPSRNHSAQALGNLRKPEAIDSLVSQLGQERWLEVRQTILGSLGKIGDASSLPFLTDVATTGEPWQVRMSADYALRRIGTPRALRVLQGLLQTEREEKLRGEIQGLLDQPSLPPHSPS